MSALQKRERQITVSTVKRRVGLSVLTLGLAAMCLSACSSSKKAAGTTSSPAAASSSASTATSPTTVASAATSPSAATSAASAAASSSVASSPATGAVDEQSGKITLWYRPGSLPSSSIAGVKKQFPNVTFNIVSSPDVDTKVAAALRTGSGLPDVTTGDPVVYAEVANKFVDLGQNGFDSTVAANYVSWKVKLGQTASGEQIGVPIDIGPIGYYYNVNAFQAAGLPTDPAAVGALVSTWAGYKQVAQKVKATGKYACDDPSYLFKYETWSKGALFYTNSGSQLVFSSSSPVIQDSFMTAMDFMKSGLCSNVQPYSTDWSSSVSQGKTVGFINPPWVGDGAKGLLETTAPAQSGQWRLASATPEGYGSEDGSELVVPKTSADPKLATQVAIWLTNPANMSSGFANDGLFPSTIPSYTSSEVTSPQAFFGGETAGVTLGSFAQKTPALLKGPDTNGADAIFMKAIVDAETSGASAQSAYQSAVSAAKTQFGNG